MFKVLFKLALFIMALALQGCSKHTVNLKGVPKSVEVNHKPLEVNVRIQIAEASAECDRRFGVGTETSNNCFLAYLQFLKIEISLDTESIVDYCEQRYPSSAQAVDDCVEDLTSLLGSLGR